MQLTPVAGASWMVPLILLSNLEAGAGQVTCGSDEFLQAGSCRPCPQCPDGEQLNDECGAAAECVPCPPDYYSNDATRHRCWRCTNCNVENKVQERSCTPRDNTICGRCLEDYFQYAGLQCHHCSIEPTDPYCKDWLAKQTTTTTTMTTHQSTTVYLWETSTSTDIKQDHAESYGQHDIDLVGKIFGIALAVIAMIIIVITAACSIAKNWESILRCCSGTTENSITEDLEKKDLDMIERQAISASQQGAVSQTNDNLGNQSSANLANRHHEEFGATTNGEAVPPGNDGARCSGQESQNGQAAKGVEFYLQLADLKEKALAAKRNMKLEDLKLDQREDLAMQLNPEPSAPGVHKNWRHFAGCFDIDKKYIDNWKDRDDPMKHVFEYLEKSTPVTVGDIMEAIQSIGRVKVLKTFCHSLLNEEYN